MKTSIYKSIWFFLLVPIYLMANIDCLAPYKCTIKVNTVNGVLVPQEIKNCRLPKMDTMPINPVDVFKEDGTLKTYFGTGETVCDVLGWMDEGVGESRKLGGMDLDMTILLDNMT